MVHVSDFWLVNSVGNCDEDVPSNSGASVDDGGSSSAKHEFERETILYQWGSKTAVRRFCRTCGILPFYNPRSNPDGYAITLPCVDWGEDGPPPTVVQSFDGVNWEKSHADTGIASETAREK